MNRGVAYAKKGAYDLASEDFEKVMNKAYDDRLRFFAYKNQGYLYREWAQEKEAQDFFLEAHRLNPSFNVHDTHVPDGVWINVSEQFEMFHDDYRSLSVGFHATIENRFAMDPPSIKQTQQPAIFQSLEKESTSLPSLNNPSIHNASMIQKEL